LHLIEIILEIIGELLLQIVLEALAELGFHSLAEPLRKTPNPWLAALGYALFGAVAGGLTLLAFPAHLTPTGSLRLVNLIVTPVLAGMLMVAFGAWRSRRGERVMRIDRFSYGYLFALALALVRFQFAV
jgi:hypothetical protein